MTRVLIVCPYGTATGGSEQWLLGILEQGTLQRAGWDIDAIVLQQGPLLQRLRALGVTAISYSMPASPAGILSKALGLRRAIRARAPDVVVGNGVKAQLAVALAVPRQPSVWVKHDHSYDRSLARVLGHRATLVVATATQVGEPTGRPDVVVLEPPRPPQPLPKDEAVSLLRDHGWQPRLGLTFGMVTRLVPYKGVDLAIHALADPRCGAWSLLVIGGDDPASPGEGERLGALARDLGVADRVCLTGELPGGGRLLTAVDAVGVLTRPGETGAPSKEGYGIVASEGMLAGVPVVVSQPGPAADRLATPEGPAGLTLASPTSEALADALRRLQDPELRMAMGSRGRTAASGLPDEQDVAVRFAGLLAAFGGS